MFVPETSTTCRSGHMMPAALLCFRMNPPYSPVSESIKLLDATYRSIAAFLGRIAKWWV